MSTQHVIAFGSSPVIPAFTNLTEILVDLNPNGRPLRRHRFGNTKRDG